jgi:hypothetical protein
VAPIPYKEQIVTGWTIAADREWIEELVAALGDRLPGSIVELARRRLDEVEALLRERDGLLEARRQRDGLLALLVEPELNIGGVPTGRWLAGPVDTVGTGLWSSHPTRADAEAAVLAQIDDGANDT